jgi:hypothetical protein
MQPDLQTWISSSGGLAEPTTPEQASAYVRAESVRWSELILSSGIKLD